LIRSELVIALPVVVLAARLLDGRRAAARAALVPAAVLGISVVANALSSR
jgi:hypothetical protein